MVHPDVPPRQQCGTRRPLRSGPAVRPCPSHTGFRARTVHPGDSALRPVAPKWPPRCCRAGGRFQIEVAARADTARRHRLPRRGRVVPRAGVRFVQRPRYRTQPQGQRKRPIQPIGGEACPSAWCRAYHSDTAMPGALEAIHAVVAQGDSGAVWPGGRRRASGDIDAGVFRESGPSFLAALSAARKARTARAIFSSLAVWWIRTAGRDGSITPLWRLRAGSPEVDVAVTRWPCVWPRLSPRGRYGVSRFPAAIRSSP